MATGCALSIRTPPNFTTVYLRALPADQTGMFMMS